MSDIQVRPLPVRRIGYWMSEKKRRKLNLAYFADLCRRNNMELVKVDLNRPLVEQGPFDVFIHKLSDVMAKAGLGDQRSHEICTSIEEYLARHPSTLVLDPLPRVRCLLDRYTQYSLLDNGPMSGLGDVFTPSFVELKTKDVTENLKLLRMANVTFPFVCKPLVAHGSSSAHEMSIIFNEAGVQGVTPPCVAQTFVNHNALLYKIFVIGDQHFTIERPSIRNLYSGGQKTVFFHSGDVSGANASSSLNDVEQADVPASVRPQPMKLSRLVDVVRERLQLALCGIDVIVEHGTGRYAVIDINAFPGYDGVPDLFEVLLGYIVQQLDRRDDKMTVCSARDDKMAARGSLVVSSRAVERENAYNRQQTMSLETAVRHNSWLLHA
ncbi:PREDICTED: inositol-tetrakisphosphate 1-kinase-like [Priapulus caudatus]|uniref:Inositol-tetrakisphosphate 1-kinase n=1 Tax=Priapulus caudatus TaxID=37621 RepID=A0ABM1E4P5_PRICU|nr:PREDICTED: inositol-tetrakisphosphate 1-kinase-like [Priapulus caudatus]